MNFDFEISRVDCSCDLNAHLLFYIPSWFNLCESHYIIIVFIQNVLMDSMIIYCIYLAIRRGFNLSRMTTNNLISSM